ncbi:MAG TPA: YkvA family protein [Polyangiaceae bacterium]|nr:YkvA family protein [Polyangiaceae bacterium]
MPEKRNVPSLARFFLDHKASPFSKLFLLFAVVYVISPVDFVPDIAIIIGWLDDLAVAAASGTSLLMAVRRYRREHAEVPAIETTGVEVRTS